MTLFVYAGSSQLAAIPLIVDLNVSGTGKSYLAQAISTEAGVPFGYLSAPSLTSAWSTQEWTRFLDGLPETLTPEQMAALDAAYHFTGTPNGEFAQRWYPLAARSGYHAADEAMAAFMQRVGRRKLIMPIYEALVKTPEGLKFAQDVFAKARPGYHPITATSVQAAIDKAQHPDPAAPR